MNSITSCHCCKDVTYKSRQLSEQSLLIQPLLNSPFFSLSCEAILVCLTKKCPLGSCCAADYVTGLQMWNGKSAERLFPEPLDWEGGTTDLQCRTGGSCHLLCRIVGWLRWEGTVEIICSSFPAMGRAASQPDSLSISSIFCFTSKVSAQTLLPLLNKNNKIRVLFSNDAYFAGRL